MIDMGGFHGGGWLYWIATVAVILLFWGLVITALVLGLSLIHI